MSQDTSSFKDSASLVKLKESLITKAAELVESPDRDELRLALEIYATIRSFESATASSRSC